MNTMAFAHERLTKQSCWPHYITLAKNHTHTHNLNTHTHTHTAHPNRWCNSRYTPCCRGFYPLSLFIFRLKSIYCGHFWWPTKKTQNIYKNRLLINHLEQQQQQQQRIADKRRRNISIYSTKHVLHRHKFNHDSLFFRCCSRFDGCIECSKYSQNSAYVMAISRYVHTVFVFYSIVSYIVFGLFNLFRRQIGFNKFYWTNLLILSFCRISMWIDEYFWW